jgi:hypothetical protein
MQCGQKRSMGAATAPHRRAWPRPLLQPTAPPPPPPRRPGPPPSLHAEGRAGGAGQRRHDCQANAVPGGHTLSTGAACMRHCRLEFMKHVLPRFCSPARPGRAFARWEALLRGGPTGGARAVSRGFGGRAPRACRHIGAWPNGQHNSSLVQGRLLHPPMRPSAQAARTPGGRMAGGFHAAVPLQRSSTRWPNPPLLWPGCSTKTRPSGR